MKSIVIFVALLPLCARAQEAPSLVLVQSTSPPKERHVGLSLGAGPGNVMLDVDYGHFYGFAALSPGYSGVFHGQLRPDGTRTDYQFIGGSIGAGGSWKVRPNSRWKFDLMGTLTPTWWGGFSTGIGLSAGFHYTAPNGLTVGFKVPLVGIAPGCTIFGTGAYDDSPCSYGATMVISYYLQAVMSVPVVSLGYRF